MGDPIHGSLARDADLFLVAVVLVKGLLAAVTTAARLMDTFYLALFIQIAFTLYDGSFGALRTVTWLLLIGAWAASELLAFFGFALPWGQLACWLAAATRSGRISPPPEPALGLSLGAAGA